MLESFENSKAVVSYKKLQHGISLFRENAF